MITVDFHRIGIKPGDRILDIGSGSGRHACEAARFAGTRVCAADRDYKEVIRTRDSLNTLERYGECRGAWSTAASDITALPFKDESYHCVVCAETLEHIVDEKKAINELVRVLKPGGALLVSVPRYLPERICWLLSREYHAVKGGHLRIYRKKRLIRILEDSGARCRGSHHAHSLHAPYWWLKCAVGVNRDDHLLVRIYHRFLVWDMMAHPSITRFLDRLLNPILGKSVVLYLEKSNR